MNHFLETYFRIGLLNALIFRKKEVKKVRIATVLHFSALWRFFMTVFLQPLSLYYSSGPLLSLQIGALSSFFLLLQQIFFVLAKQLSKHINVISINIKK